MSQPPIHSLLEDLKSADSLVRDHAIQQFWEMWFMQKGVYGLQQLRRSQTMLENGEVLAAEALLNQIIEDQPDFAEAWNRRAVLYYTIGEFQRSLHDCGKVVAMIPHHFGALHGMGLCYAAIGEYEAAIRAFRRTLELQPHSLINKKLILECTVML